MRNSPSPVASCGARCEVQQQLGPSFKATALHPTHQCTVRRGLIILPFKSKSSVLTVRKQRTISGRFCAAGRPGACTTRCCGYVAQRSPQNPPGNEAHTSRLPPPLPLPSPPSSPGLLAVLLYTFRICFSEKSARWRLAAVFFLVLVSRGMGFLVPVYFKQAVDAAGLSAIGLPWWRRPVVHALVAAGACRTVSGCARDLQSPTFQLISQAAGRRMAYYGLEHVLRLGATFHSQSTIGTLARMLDRGKKSAATMCRAIVFRFLPTCIEIVAVASVLSRLFHPALGVIVAVTALVYTWYTVSMTQAAVEGKREMKTIDNAINGSTLEVLLNQELVTLLDCRREQMTMYDRLLWRYQVAAVRFELLTGGMSSVQTVILTTGLVSALISVAVTSGKASDLVLVQGLLLQLWAPLQSVGGTYRRLKKALVNLEDYVALMRKPVAPPDGWVDLPLTWRPSSGTHRAAIAKSPKPPPSSSTPAAAGAPAAAVAATPPLPPGGGGGGGEGIMAESSQQRQQASTGQYNEPARSHRLPSHLSHVSRLSSAKEEAAVSVCVSAAGGPLGSPHRSRAAAGITVPSEGTPGQPVSGSEAVPSSGVGDPQPEAGHQNFFPEAHTTDQGNMTSSPCRGAPNGAADTFSSLSDRGRMSSGAGQGVAAVHRKVHGRRLTSVSHKLPGSGEQSDSTDNSSRTREFNTAATRAESTSRRRRAGGKASTDDSTLHSCIADTKMTAGNLGIHVRMDDVFFDYESDRLAQSLDNCQTEARKKPYEAARLINGLSLEILPGEIVAIVGPPGCGKSTILRLMMRTYDAASGGGCVSLNGVDVRQLRRDSISAAVAAIPQNVSVVNDSVAANIAFGWPGAKAADVADAARRGQLDKALKLMPEGLDTQVGERGLKVSGGERQRIAVARALVRQPRLLLCDEVTSALDPSTEDAILQELFEVAARGCTVVMVSHNLRSIARCDRVLVLNHGRFMDAGTPHELRSRPGWFSSEWVLQGCIPPLGEMQSPA